MEFLENGDFLEKKTTSSDFTEVREEREQKAAAQKLKGMCECGLRAARFIPNNACHPER